MMCKALSDEPVYDQRVRTQSRLSCARSLALTATHAPALRDRGGHQLTLSSLVSGEGAKAQGGLG